MPILIVLLALLAPRIALILLWLFSSVIDRAFDGLLWPVLGLIFMPFTTLAYAFAIVMHGAVSGGWLVLVIVAALADLGAFSGGARARRG